MSRKLYDHLISVNYGEINKKIKQSKKKVKQVKKKEGSSELYEGNLSGIKIPNIE